jgi:hypothetical protein
VFAGLFLTKAKTWTNAEMAQPGMNPIWPVIQA